MSAIMERRKAQSDQCAPLTRDHHPFEGVSLGPLRLASSEETRLTDRAPTGSDSVCVDVMPPRKRKEPPTPPVVLPPGRPDEEEVFSVHSIDDSSEDGVDVSPDMTAPRRSARKRTREDEGRPQNGRVHSKIGPIKLRRPNNAKAEVTLSISDDTVSDAGSSVVIDEDEGLVLEEVASQRDGASLDPSDNAEQDMEEDEELELEDVHMGEAENGVDEEHADAYTNAYKAADAQAQEEEAGTSAAKPDIYYDGKGQANGISIDLGYSKASNTLSPSKRKGPIITPRDRQVRMATHKLVVLSMIAHTRHRNHLINHDRLRDDLYSMVPNTFLEKLRMIHPKKVPVQNERVRQFESFLRDLTRWWSHKFTLDPLMTTCGALRQPNADMLSGVFAPPGRRVDGWIVENSNEREERHRSLRRSQKAIQEREKKDPTNPDTTVIRRSSRRSSKGKAREVTTEEPAEVKMEEDQDAQPKHPLSEITLFGLGDSTTPCYLRLSDHGEVIRSVDDLIACAHRMSGSREASAQLFASLCRSLGIPSRLVVSIQTPSWSVGASKVASSSGTPNAKGSSGKRDGRTNAIAKHLHNIRKSANVMTSDEESFAGSVVSAGSVEKPVSTTRRSTRTAAKGAVGEAGASAPAVQRRSSRRTGQAETDDVEIVKENKAKGSAGETDYRDEKWHNVDKPIAVKYVPKLRIQKPKALKETEVAADTHVDADPVDTSLPPTLWVEVFSKPWQKWITVDPVRGAVEPLNNRQMEPSPSDKSNRLVYVLAFEEDGYARDVTARYTRTLHSRIARMRPPMAKKQSGDDWWARVVAAVHRPEKLNRDAAEDIELEQAASREPMPSSVAGFKDHPVYALEKHLKRDEVIFPAKQAGTFQGTPVFLRANVIVCRSARQWYNEGRVVKDGEEALKWVKSRGYTLANKRAEEEARQQGFDGLQEGLYASFQTDIYRPPPVVDGRIPTNSFGNLDLFVETMLPPGAVHIPYNGAGKVAKQLGVHYAEAIVGFEFRKHRSMPQLKGIVVAEEHGDEVLEAYWTAEKANAERDKKRKRDRQIKEWKKKLSAAQIRQRIRREYGHVDGIDLGSDDEDDHEFSDREESDSSADDGQEDDEEAEVEGEGEEGEEGDHGSDGKHEEEEDLRAYRRARRARKGASVQDDVDEEVVQGGGGFLID